MKQIKKKLSPTRCFSDDQQNLQSDSKISELKQFYIIKAIITIINLFKESINIYSMKIELTLGLC